MKLFGFCAGGDAPVLLQTLLLCTLIHLFSAIGYFGGLWEINGSIRNETNPAGYAWEAIALNCAAAGKLTIKIPL
ncbi:hypothetical protein [Enterocloster clostridioformis]|jgi:hypothetical protein|uniref:hypothetical protein n=1 Tax=Enterocloster clostridioformis TaxID=1531 RepID=UPI001105834C|nr:hypothetical protein [Enterocloster clostridioformis]MCA5580018.1 hypothetical protein [Enterocloster clostridioformis]MCI6127909.1 hypothetical protein [Enterocloster clostridioformis]MCI7609049.1 hypothetical protein [Enterocloster clostridioformis]MDB2129106.1 hypothetical protein [Enterocloster clostridioformis]MDU1960793.1 hypothetical protein [Enterocloster clostridioformis]